MKEQLNTKVQKPEKTPGSKDKKRKRWSWNRRIIVGIWSLALGPLLLIFIGFFLASIGVFGELPSLEDIEHPENNFATEVLSMDGKILGKYYIENRTPVTFDELPEHLSQALVATEDERFYDHAGVDAKALGRAVVKRFIGGTAGGASTITQQLAKMFFTKRRHKNIFVAVLQKFKEWVIAAQLERNYTKEEIIAHYFNKFDFLYQAVGIKSAAKIYFDKTPSELTITECAVLVGMAKNPSLYNPKKYPKRSLKRRNIVLSQMVRNGFLSEEQKAILSEEPIALTFNRQSHNTGLSTYFREFLRKELTDWAKTSKKPSGEPYNIYSDGLKIYTTIDSRLQSYAEEAVSEHHKEIQAQMYKHQSKRKTAPWPWDYSTEKIEENLWNTARRSEAYRLMKNAGASEEDIKNTFQKPRDMELYTMDGVVDTVLSPMDSILHMKYIIHHSMMSLEPQTGFIKTWVGGIDHRYFKYDNVKKGKRQVGSTFKPFVYATAIDQHNFTPCDEVPNVPVNFEREEWRISKDWQPKNSDGKYGGVYTLKDALANSINTVTAYLMKQVGPKKVVELAKQMGVESDLPELPSICLGTPDISVFEMVGAYGTFANKGIYTKPIYILRIEDKNGTILYNYSPETRAVLSEEKAYVMLNLMQGVTQSGTGRRLQFRYKLYNAIAGKTGTTQNNMDGWFMGIVPNLVTGVWSGCEDPAIRFSSTRLGQGANTALPIWGLFMQKVYADPSLSISKSSFEKPSSMLNLELDCNKETSLESNLNQEENAEFRDDEDF